MNDLFDAPAAQQVRNAALDTAAEHSNSFMGRACAAFPLLFADGELVLGEDIRARMKAAGISPNHHNAWGALTMTLIKAKRLTKTGVYRSMTAETSHARVTAEYRVAKL